VRKYSDIQDLESNRNEWLKRLKNGDEQMLRVLYHHFRNDFVRWIQSKTSCNETEALDVFQDSVVGIYHNIQKGTLTEFDKSIRAYLFTIGKYIYIKKFKKKKQLEITSFGEANSELEKMASEPIPNADSIKDEQQKLILLLLRQMKEPCKGILDLFYYQNKTLKEIAAQLNYGSANVVKVQKVRCMNRLRAAAEKMKKRRR